MKYTLWRLVHESIYTVTAEKVKDTNSVHEIDRWKSKSWYNAASMYREEKEINANYVSFFND